MRAQIRLGTLDRAGTLEDLRVADKTLPASAGQRLLLGSMFSAAGDDEAALPNFDAWLQAHPEDAQRPSGLNGRCWSRALLRRELDKALDDCNAAVRMRPQSSTYLDSRAFVRLRRGELSKALADYDAAIRLSPSGAWSIYCRSVVRKRLGDIQGAVADRATAVALKPDVVERGLKLGIES